MDDLDTARENMANTIAHLEDAISAALPGQAPVSTADDVCDAIRETRASIDKAVQALDKAENQLLQLGDDGT